MAIAIASVPVLTGKVAQKFEAEAQSNYERFLNRGESENKEIADRYERGMKLVREVLAKSRIGNR